MNKRFIVTIATLFIIGIGALIAGYIAKGYRLSPSSGTLMGTGIISVTSLPDQASVYLDGHLITATNANINSLEPKEYTLKIHKDGFIDWEKKIEVREGLVTEIKATLFPALPSVYPLTYNGVTKTLLSDDGTSLAFIVPRADKKGGLWVWTMKEAQIAFARGGEPHQIMLPQSDIDLDKVQLRWSPDSKQILLTIDNRYLLLEQNRLNDPPRDITPIVQATLRSWEEDQRTLDAAKINTIQDIQLKKIASASAYLKWSPDETKFIYSQDGKQNFKSADLKTNRTFDLPKAHSYSWLSNSLHLVIIDELAPAPSPGLNADQKKITFPTGKISIMEFEGTNKSEIFAGQFDLTTVFSWPDASRIVMLYSLPTTTASQPNLYGINLK